MSFIFHGLLVITVLSDPAQIFDKVHSTSSADLVYHSKQKPYPPLLSSNLIKLIDADFAARSEKREILDPRLIIRRSAVIC